jgi:hypothetical protein
MKNLVIQNKAGQVVRYLRTGTDKFFLIHRQDTGRIENVNDVKELEESKIPFSIIKEVDIKNIGEKGIEVHKGTFLKFVDEVNEIEMNVRLKEDNDDNLKKAFQYVALVNVLFLVFAFGLSWYLNRNNEEVEMQVVHIEPRHEPKPIVEPMKQKTKKNVRVAKHIVKPTVTPTKSLRPSAKPKKMVAINTLGAVGVLGALSNSNAHHGGLKVNSIQTSRGAGLGGAAGSGGMQSSFYGRGLVGASLGAGNKINGQGGIGTRGKGGGQAGYGNLSLVGTSGAFFQPVEEESIVEGGLDRDEIAAVVRRHEGQIRFCYETGLQSAPGLSGRVGVKWVINGSGYVSSIHVGNSSLKNKSVENCILQRVKSWKFPEPRGGVNVRVNFPFNLKRISQS